MRKPVLLTADEIVEMDGGGGFGSVIENVGPMSSEDAIQIARGFEIAGARCRLTDFDSAAYSERYRGEGKEEVQEYLAFRSKRTKKARAGFAIDPVDPVPHLGTAIDLMALDETEAKQVKATERATGTGNAPSTVSIK